MSTDLKLYSLTPPQTAFLDALAGPARGDMKLAKELAGYSDKTNLQDIIRPLSEHIIRIAKEVLVNHAPEAAYGLVGVLQQPYQMGAGNRVSAAKEILDRIGVVKPTEDNSNISKPAIFILPPKDIKSIEVVNGNVRIDMNTDAIKTITNSNGVYDDMDEPPKALDTLAQPG